MPSIWAAQQSCGLLLKHFHSAKMVCPDPEISLSGTEIFPFPWSKDRGIEELAQQLPPKAATVTLAEAKPGVT